MFYEVYERLDHAHHIDDTLVIEHDIRVKGRFKSLSQKGIEVRVFLERGKTLTVGEVLKTACGKNIAIVGAKESVTEAHCDSWVVFSQACYHLGNRHVKVQVGERWLRIKPDYVLEGMLTQLGLTLTTSNTVFIPEEGAYSGKHSHSNEHSYGGRHHH